MNHFFAAWQRNGWEAGVLGYPTSDEIVNNPGNPTDVGRRQEFQGGTIYWKLNDAYYVTGAIRDKWRTLGSEGGALGYPTSDETVLPDRQGRMNRFDNGVIYWSPTTAAHPVSGVILDEWQAQGYEAGRYGYPVGDEYQVDGGKGQQFQRDTIYGYPFIRPTPVAGNYGEYVFTPVKTGPTDGPDFYDTDNNGTFTAGVVYDATKTYKMYWSFRVAPQLQAIATTGMDSMPRSLS